MGRRVTLWRELDFFFKRSLLAALECGLEGSVQARDGLESFAVVQEGGMRPGVGQEVARQ